MKLAKILACLLSASCAPLAIVPISAASAEAARFRSLPNGVEATSAIGSVRATALTDSIIRVRVAKHGRLGEDASWAVPAQVRHESARVTPTAHGFRTSSIELRIDPSTLKVEMLDLHGKLISGDTAPVRMNGNEFELRKSMTLAEHYFGMGDKTGALDRRGSSFTNWDSDTPGFTSATDPIYKSIPFFIAAGGPGGSYGLFLDNTFRSTFDFGHSVADTVRISSVDGPIDYYLIAGPTVPEVVRRYTDLTGKPPLAPLWSLGYQQSRWSYMSDAEVRTLADRFRQEHFPIDVIWLDIDYQDHNRPFTVNRATFPDMRKLVADMGSQGIKLVPITDLHVAYLPNKGYAPFDSGIAGNNFVHDGNGKLFVGPVWPGPAVFPDFTRASTRQWWGSLYRDFIADGFAGFWNDMNEPSVFDTPTKTMPLTNLHRIESDDFAPRTATHAEVHNVYGMQNTRGTYEGMLRWRPGVRPFVMTRASYAGGQRYAVTWTGDNSSTWDHLRLSVEQLINLGLSGFSYSAADVGGFTGGASPELMTRWFEVATFTPIFRDHSMKDAPRAEPWVDGPEQLAIRKRYVEERYRLLPYIYALAEQNSRTGDPIMRPVFYDYPDALVGDCDRSMNFTLGRSLLIAGPPKPESPEPFDICLPKGGWYDYWTGLPVSQAKLTETPKLDLLPVFVRAGTILPRQPVVHSTAERPSGALSLDVYPGENCSGEIYADDGTTIGGPNLRQQISCSVTPRGVQLHFSQRSGTYSPWWNAISVTVHGWSTGAGHVSNGLNAVADPRAQTLRFTMPDQASAAEVLISS